MGGSNGDTTEKFTVKSNGNIGIGTITPASKLDVSGGVNATQYLLNGAPVNFSSEQPQQWVLPGQIYITIQERLEWSKFSISKTRY